MVKISIIMPSLNVAQYIHQCLQSVIHQTLKEIEIICVDAGSTDGTLDIIRHYAEKDSRIQLIISDKRSYGYQMNLGMDRATGEYIGIVETDDYVPADMYEELYTIAVREQAEIVKADFYRFRSLENKTECSYNRLDASDRLYGRILCPGQELRVFRAIMNTWSGIYLRSFLNENHIRHNETPGASYQDNGFWFRGFCCAERLYLVDRPFYMNRRDNAESSVASKGKVYCMSEEWGNIYLWLIADSKRYDRFIGAFTLKLYHNLLTTYQRIAPEYREGFIRHMGQWINLLLENGEYDQSIFTPYEWNRIHLIANDPMAYHSLCTGQYGTLAAQKMAEKVFHRSKLCIRILRRLGKLHNKLQMLFSWLRYDGIRNTGRRYYWKNKIIYIEKAKKGECL